MSARGGSAVLGRRLGVIILAAFAGGGCPPDKPTPPPVDVTNLASAVANAWCTTATNCGEFASDAACLAAVNLDYGQLVADKSAGIVKYDDAKAGECIAELTSGAGHASCSVTEQLSAAPTADCAGAIVGILSRGAPCFADNECAAGVCVPKPCPADEACCAGACGFIATAADDCSTPGAVCPAGSYCPDEAPASNPTCRAWAKPKDKCDDSKACEPGSLCLFDELGMRTCKVLPSTGEACIVASGCNSILDYCDGRTCQSRAQNQESCKSKPCVPTASCDDNGMCVDRLGRDDPCSSGEQCQGTLSCIGGTCQQAAPPPVCSLRSPPAQPSPTAGSSSDGGTADVGGSPSDADGTGAGGAKVEGGVGDGGGNAVDGSGGVDGSAGDDSDGPIGD